MLTIYLPVDLPEMELGFYYKCTEPTTFRVRGAGNFLWKSHALVPVNEFAKFDTLLTGAGKVYEIRFQNATGTLIVDDVTVTRVGCLNP